MALVKFGCVIVGLSGGRLSKFPSYSWRPALLMMERRRIEEGDYMDLMRNWSRFFMALERKSLWLDLSDLDRNSPLPLFFFRDLERNSLFKDLS